MPKNAVEFFVNLNSAPITWRVEFNSDRVPMTVPVAAFVDTVELVMLSAMIFSVQTRADRYIMRITQLSIS